MERHCREMQEEGEGLGLTLGLWLVLVGVNVIVSRPVVSVCLVGIRIYNLVGLTFGKIGKSNVNPLSFM